MGELRPVAQDAELDVALLWSGRVTRVSIGCDLSNRRCLTTCAFSLYTCQVKDLGRVQRVADASSAVEAAIS